MSSVLRLCANRYAVRLAVLALITVMTTLSPAESRPSNLTGEPPACPTSGNVVCCGPKATPTTPEVLGPGNAGDDLRVYGGTCQVNPGSYMYQNINIYNGGTLQFSDGATNLSAAKYPGRKRRHNARRLSRQRWNDHTDCGPTDDHSLWLRPGTGRRGRGLQIRRAMRGSGHGRPVEASRQQNV